MKYQIRKIKTHKTFYSTHPFNMKFAVYSIPNVLFSLNFK